VIGFVVWEVSLQEFEFPINSVDEPHFARESVNESDTSCVNGPSSIGNLIAHGGSGEHWLWLIRPVYITEAVFDSFLPFQHVLLALEYDFCSSSLHSKTPFCTKELGKSFYLDTTRKELFESIFAIPENTQLINHACTGSSP
jgi:hypothetical protein